MLENQPLYEEHKNSSSSQSPKRFTKKGRVIAGLGTSVLLGGLLGAGTQISKPQPDITYPPDAVHLGSVVAAPITKAATVVSKKDVITVKRGDESYFSPFLAIKGDAEYGDIAPLDSQVVSAAAASEELLQVWHKIIAQTCEKSHVRIVGAVSSQKAVQEAVCEVSQPLTVFIEGSTLAQAQSAADAVRQLALITKQPLKDLVYAATNTSHSNEVIINSWLTEPLVVEGNVWKDVDTFLTLVLLSFLGAFVTAGAIDEIFVKPRKEKEREELHAAATRERMSMKTHINS